MGVRRTNAGRAALTAYGAFLLLLACVWIVVGSFGFLGGLLFNDANVPISMIRDMFAPAAGLALLFAAAGFSAIVGASSGNRTMLIACALASLAAVVLAAAVESARLPGELLFALFHSFTCCMGPPPR